MYTTAELVLLPVCFLVMVGIAVLLRFLLKGKTEKIRSIPFIVITILLWVGEIIKQILELTSAKGYDFWALPLHLCSTYFIWFALAEFTGAKIRVRMQNIAFVMTLYVVVGLYAGPRTIIGSSCENVFASYSTAHTFFFHHLVILYALLTVALGRFHPQKKDVWLFAGCMAAYFVIACACAHLLKENYLNLLYSNVPFMEALRVQAGQVVYTIVYGLAMTTAGTIFIALYLWIKGYLQKKKESAE